MDQLLFSKVDQKWVLNCPTFYLLVLAACNTMPIWSIDDWRLFSGFIREVMKALLDFLCCICYRQCCKQCHIRDLSLYSDPKTQRIMNIYRDWQKHIQSVHWPGPMLNSPFCWSQGLLRIPSCLLQVSDSGPRPSTDSASMSGLPGSRAQHNNIVTALLVAHSATLYTVPSVRCPSHFFKSQTLAISQALSFQYTLLAFCVSLKHKNFR